MPNNAPASTARIGAAWPHMIGNLAVLALAMNTLVHSRDARTSVVPEGVILSAVTVCILLFTRWAGWSMVYRYRVGAHSWVSRAFKLALLGADWCAIRM
jgi:uncharacterized membrane protein